MLSVMISCPRTGEPVYTRIEIDEASFARLPKVPCRIWCPICGREHSWTNHEAWLTRGGWLIAAEGSSGPAVLLRLVACASPSLRSYNSPFLSKFQLSQAAGAGCRSPIGSQAGIAAQHRAEPEG
jgi:hypothetical protein